MADSEKKKDKKRKDSAVKASEQAAAAASATPEKKKEKEKEKKKDKKVAEHSEPAETKEASHDNADKTAHKSKSKSKKAEKHEDVAHDEKPVVEEPEVKKEKKDKKKDKKKEATDEIEPVESGSKSAVTEEKASETAGNETESKPSKKKSKDHEKESHVTEEKKVEHSGEVAAASHDDSSAVKTEETGTKSKKSKKSEEHEKTESHSAAAEETKEAPAAQESSHHEETKKSKSSKKGKEKDDDDDDAHGEPDIDLSILRTDQEKTVEELLEDGWVAAPTERPKARPEKPLPRVPGQAIDEQGAGVWASMSRPDFKALGLLPDEEEAPQPVEEETPKEKPLDFSASPVAEKYDVGPEVFRSGSTRTHTAKAKEGGQEVFVMVSSKEISPVYSKKSFRTAEKALTSLKDAPHVQSPIESFVGKEASYFVVSKNEGELTSVIKTKMADVYSEKHAALVIKQMLHAVAASHANNVLHRDATVFSLYVRSFSADNIEVELGNFVAAIKIRDPAKLPTEEPSCSDLFKSPEIAAGDAYGFPSDIWAVGCTAYFLLCGHAPFSNEKNRLRRRMSIKSAVIPMADAEFKDVSADARDFIKKLLTAKPSDRLTASQALEHPWIAKGGAATLLPQVPQHITL